MKNNDFEKLGAFYLGKRVAAENGETLDELVLYDSKDLNTHAAIIGMTGSGKTGLGIGLIEEAAMDRVPVLAIDPKGDLANLLLTFPQFRGKDFEPWVDARTATDKGQTVEEYAADQAKLWKNGLQKWGQKPDRVRQLKANCDFQVYTPGSSAGQPICVLNEFAAPAEEVRSDNDLYSDIVSGTATGLLSLLGIDADPISSREHILVTNILRSCWDENKSLDLPGLIAAIQEPPFRKVGVIDVDSFYAPKDRFAFAMQVNNLLASPGFAAWIEGQSLNIDELLYTSSGQPRVAVLSIAHLDDRERMFFVTMLLNALLGWMRRQSGSSALRALLYIDELFGYMPPTANPPSKKPLLTLLKQARAFGVGVVVSTQNPVDLDYKGMSNMGSWFIGRLQTQRDKKRVLDGLKSASGTGDLDPKELSATLSGLGKRCFLLHNVHESGPVIFNTRWVMSYLAGPLTRDQIKLLTANAPKHVASEKPASTATTEKAVTKQVAAARPVFEPGIRQTWISATRMPREGESVVYVPELFARCKVTYTNARMKIDTDDAFALSLELDAEDPAPIWDHAEETLLNDVTTNRKAAAGANFAEAPAALCKAKNIAAWEKKLKSWIRTERPLRVLKSAKLKLTSTAGESERDFRIRLQEAGREVRDIKVGKLRKTYEAKVDRLEARLMRAEQALDRESQQASASKVDTALSVGTAILGALLGRKRVSVTSASRAGTAARRAGNMRKQMGDVKRAEQTIARLEQDIEKLKEDFDEEVEAMENAYDAQSEELEEVVVRARSTNIRIDWFGVGWRPEFIDSQ